MESLLIPVDAAGAGAEADYWMRWQTIVCALIVVVPAVGAVAVAARARAEPFRAVDFWAPCWGRLHPAWLLAYRSVVFLVMVCLLLETVLPDKLVQFYFYTQWTFTLIIVYFAIAAIVSARGCWLYSTRCITQHVEENILPNTAVEQNYTLTLPFRFNKNDNAMRFYGQEADERGAGFWEYAMQLVYQTSAGAVMLTDVVFWFVLEPTLSSNHIEVNAIMICMHSLNALFLLIDTLLNRLQFPLFRMAYFVLWSCTYVTFQWILHACGLSWWPYPFMRLDNPWSPLWYFGMALIHVPCYGLYWLIVRGKNLFCSKIFPRAYTRTY